MDYLLQSLEPRALLTSLALAESFGRGGVVRLNYGPTFVVNDAYPKLDNMVLVAGGLYGNLIVVRLKANGARDMTFGSNGRFKYDLGGDDSVTTIEPDGSGWLLTTNNLRQLRISAKGRFDREFGVQRFTPPTSGITSWDIGSFNGSTYRVAFDARVNITRLYSTNDSTGVSAAVKLLERPTPFVDSFGTEHSVEDEWEDIHFFPTSDGKIAALYRGGDGNPATNDERVLQASFWELSGNWIGSRALGPSLDEMRPTAISASRLENGSIACLMSIAEGVWPNQTYNQQVVIIDALMNELVKVSSADFTPKSPNILAATRIDSSSGNHLFLSSAGRTTRFDLNLESDELTTIALPPALTSLSPQTNSELAESHVLSNGQVALYTKQVVNRYNRLVLADSDSDSIILSESEDDVTVSVNGTSVSWSTTDISPLTGTNTITINAGGGNDSLLLSTRLPVNVKAGEGADTVRGGYGNETIDGGAGNDLLFGSDGQDLLDGGTGNDRLYGGSDGDTLAGGAGHDFLDGQVGIDSFNGGSGDDTIVSDTSQYGVTVLGNTVMHGETVRGGSGRDRAYLPGQYTESDSIEMDFVPPA